MSIRENLEKEKWLMVLSLLVAVLLWLFTAGERDGQIVLNVPLEYGNLSTDLAIVNHPPAQVEVTVAGPRILLLKLKRERIKIMLDLRSVREGSTVFGGLERLVRLDRELRVTGLSPAVVEVKTAAARRPQGK